MPAPEAILCTYGEFNKDELRFRRQRFREVEGWGDEVVLQSPEVNNFVIKVRTGCDRKKVEECRGLSLFSADDVVSLPLGRDMAHVAIIDTLTGVEVYSRVVYRTRTFHRDLFKRVWVTWMKVLDPPFCPECKTRMEICKRRINGQTWWGCRSDAMHHHKKAIWFKWDVMLTDKALQFAREMRDARRASEAVQHAER